MAVQERTYIIRVSALLDRSTAAAAGDLVQTYDRAAKASGRRLSEEERQARRVASEKERAEQRVAAAQDRNLREQARRQEAAGRKAQRDEERAADAKARAHERAERYVERIRDRHFREEQRRQESAERNLVRERRQRVGQIAGDTIANAAAAGRKALGVAGQITGGLGIDFSLQSGVAKGVELEKLAVAIVNAGNRGTGTAAQRDRDVSDLQKTSREIGNKFAFDPRQVLQGLAQYQALTGDLDTAKAGLNDLAALAKAFNVDLDKMVAAAGQVGSAIGEVGEGKEFATAADKAKAVNDVLRTMTAQGQEGAIEIANLATQMAKLKAAGGMFEGSTAENIKKMGALAQLSLQLGGSASPTQAATSVMGFVSTLKTPARRREFAAAGVDIDSATQKGAFADPFEIIKRSLAATKGDPEAMKKLFANVVGERAVTALTTAYNKAGGGEKGLKAVQDQFARFGGTVSDKTLQENLNRALGTKESKAQLQQNAIDARWAQLSDRVLPSLERLAPAADKLIDAFATGVEWVSNHLGASVAIAISASIAKAAIGPMIAKALTESIATKGLGGAISAGAGRIPTGGAAVAGITILATAAYLSVKEFNEQRAGAAKTEQERIANAEKLIADAAKQKGPLSKEQIDAVAMTRADLEASRTAGREYKADEDLNWFEKFGAGVADFFTGDEAGKGKAELEGRGKEAAAQSEKLDAVIQKLDAQIKAFVDSRPKGPIDVNVVGGIPTGGNGNGRQGVPDQGG